MGDREPEREEIEEPEREEIEEHRERRNQG